MTNSKYYQGDFVKNSYSQDIFKRPKDMTKRQVLEDEELDRMKRWITFFRRNPHRFILDYFGVHLYPYQILMIWVLQRSTLAYIVASRAAAKTFIIAIWAMTLAVLYPGMKIKVCSKTLKQAGLIVKKIEELKQDHPNVNREIDKITTNQNSYICTFHCGSAIEAVPSSDTARGNRASYIIIEESRLVPKNILEPVIKPFLEVYSPPYLFNEKYRDDEDLIKEPIISYITSAWYKSEYWYTYVVACIRKMLSGDEESNFLAFDYLITLYHHIKTEKTLKDEMSDNDELTNQMEYLNIPSGASGKSYFRPSLFKRNIKRAFYPQREDTYNSKKNPYGMEKIENEIRIVSCDIATRANRNNDLSISACIKLIPLFGKGYERSLVYVESHKGINVVTQAKRIKEIFTDFNADYLVLDLLNAGVAVYDALSQVLQHDERGIVIPAFTVVGDEFTLVDNKLREDLTNRTLGLGALPVIFPIQATQSLNSHIAVIFRSSLQKKLWNFLVDENTAEEFLIRNNKEFMADANNSEITAYYLAPYVQASLFIGECINLDMTLANGNVRLQERPGLYKDRFSAVSYANYFIDFLDKSLLQETEDYNSEKEVMGVTMVY